MDFPVFHLDFLGNRMLVALIAVFHVMINHSLAVGAMPLVTALEFWGHRTGDKRWDRLGYRILTVCFVVTTTVGALTGVGIWLSTSLVNWVRNPGMKRPSYPQMPPISMQDGQYRDVATYILEKAFDTSEPS